jgi:hypothetical protein
MVIGWSRQGEEKRLQGGERRAMWRWRRECERGGAAGGGGGVAGGAAGGGGGGGGGGIGGNCNLDRTLIHQRLGSSSPRGREQSQKDEEQLFAWNLEADQLVESFVESKCTSYAHNQRYAYQDQGHDVQEFAAEGQRRGWWRRNFKVVCRRSACSGYCDNQFRAVVPHVFGEIILGEENPNAFCPGVNIFVSLVSVKSFMSDVPGLWLTSGQNKLPARTGLSYEERVAGGGSAWSVKRFGSLCTSTM